MIETVTVKRGYTNFRTFDDGVAGRFEHHFPDTLHVILQDSHGVFFKESLTGSIDMINEVLAAVNIQVAYE